MEATLTLQKQDYEARVGVFLGWGRGAAFGEPAWTSQQTNAIKECVDSGIRQFNDPVLSDGSGYDWSFLRPLATLDFPLAATQIQLPDDFGGAEGMISVLAPTNQLTYGIPFINPGMIREKYALLPTATAAPEFAAIEWQRGGQATQAQRANLLIWPQADQDYTIQFAYYVLPDYVTGATPYPYGAQAHSETILASCFAAAEFYLDNDRGVCDMRFKERLMASVAKDRKSKPQNREYNGDRSDGREWRLRDWRYPNPVSFNGVVYGE